MSGEAIPDDSETMEGIGDGLVDFGDVQASSYLQHDEDVPDEKAAEVETTQPQPQQTQTTPTTEHNQHQESY